ncbi:MAG: hypothetical protein ACM3NQ_24795 [Bacteroidales bacterium]
MRRSVACVFFAVLIFLSPSGAFAQQQNGGAATSGDPQKQKKPPAEKPPQCAALEQDLFIDLKEVVKAGCTPSLAQISKLLENPVANFVSIPLQYDYITLEGERMGTKAVQRLQVTPTFPTRLGKNWSLINRIVFPFLSVPFNKQFGNCFGMAANEILSCPSLPEALEDPFKRTSGFGDIVYVGAVAPKKSIKIESTGGVVIWGLGATAMFPTSSQDVLGTGKYSLGPTGVVGYLGKTWTMAVFPQQWWSIAGNANRSDVNLTNIQYFIYYAPPGLNPDAAWRIGMSPNISINWKAQGDKVTLPLGLGVSRMVNIGPLPVNIDGEVEYAVIHPGDKPGSRWNVRLYFVAVIPTFAF